VVGAARVPPADEQDNGDRNGSDRHPENDDRTSHRATLQTDGAAEAAPTIEGGEVLHLPARYEAGRVARARRLSFAAPGEVAPG